VKTISLNAQVLHTFGYDANGSRVAERRSDGTLVFFVGGYFEYSVNGSETPVLPSPNGPLSGKSVPVDFQPAGRLGASRFQRSLGCASERHKVEGGVGFGELCSGT